MMTVSQGYSSLWKWKSGCMMEMMVVGKDGDREWKCIEKHRYGNSWLWEHIPTVMTAVKRKVRFVLQIYKF